jgi:hypothetical protein
MLNINKVYVKVKCASSWLCLLRNYVTMMQVNKTLNLGKLCIDRLHMIQLNIYENRETTRKHGNTHVILAR